MTQPTPLPPNDPIAWFLERDIKAGAILYFVLSVVLMLLFLLIFFGSLIDPQPIGEKIQALLFTTLFLLGPALLFWRIGIKRRNPMTNKIYAAYVEHPEKIVWVYIKKVQRVANARYDIVMCDNSGKSRVVPSLSNNYEERLNAIAKRCAIAVMGYQETWEKLYKSSPVNFVNDVKKSMVQKDV